MTRIEEKLRLLLLGIILAAYWARVLRMARRARRRTGRAANLVPRERLGLALRAIWAPIIAIWVVHPFLCALFPMPRLLRPLYYAPWIAWPALTAVWGCWLLSRACWKSMGRHWRMGIDPAEQNVLIITGPFARVRHPIYGLSGMMMLCTMIMLPSPLMLCAGVVHIVLLVWESVREERHMARIHGAEYAQYRFRTGAFLPRL